MFLMQYCFIWKTVPQLVFIKIIIFKHENGISNLVIKLNLEAIEDKTTDDPNS